jgi:dihydrolipoamide dehydrogenase
VGYIKVDEYCTNVPGIYAIGDVLATQALAHVASAEGITCVEAIAGHHPEPIDYNNIPAARIASPEVASVGLHRTSRQRSRLRTFGRQIPVHGLRQSQSIGAPRRFCQSHF